MAQKEDGLSKPGIGPRMKIARKKLSISQATAASRAGFDASYYGRLERELHIPTYITLQGLAIALETTIAHLSGETEYAHVGPKASCDKTVRQMIQSTTMEAGLLDLDGPTMAEKIDYIYHYLKKKEEKE